MRENQKIFDENDLVVIVSRERKFLIKLKKGANLQTDKGILKHDHVIGKSPGARVETNTGYPFYAVFPTLSDLMLKVKRKSQIVYPKDMGYIFMNSGLKPGDKVVEVGTGSGSATVALAWLIGESGKVYTYERRSDFRKLAEENLKKYGLENRVKFFEEEVSREFPGLPEKVDFAFIDVPEPWNLIGAVEKALKKGKRVFFLLPTWNQVIKLLESLESGSFIDVELSEVLLRNFKINPARVRPLDRMVSHTAFLTMATLIEEEESVDKTNIEKPEKGEACAKADSKDKSNSISEEDNR